VHIIILLYSVVILAFVKSEGKSSEKSSESEPHSPNESTSLLTDKNSSLEGSLRERVVSIDNMIIIIINFDDGYSY
jgi:hypothetical protein